MKSILPLFQLPRKEISSFGDVPAADLEEVHAFVSASAKPFKISDSKTNMKFEYQILTDIVAKGILAKAGSFAIATMEKFQILTVILKGTPINWASFLFGIFKNIFQQTKQSKGYGVQICYIFSDSGLLEDEDVPTHKYKVFNAASIKSQGNWSAAISNWFKVKQETAEEQQQEKAVEKSNGKATAKAPKVPKAKSVVELKAKGKRKVEFQESDSEKSLSPKLVKKSRTLEAKPADPTSLPIFSSVVSEETLAPAVEPRSVAPEVAQEDPIPTAPLSTTTALVEIPQVATGTGLLKKDFSF